MPSAVTTDCMLIIIVRTVYTVFNEWILHSKKKKQQQQWQQSNKIALNPESIFNDFSLIWIENCIHTHWKSWPFLVRNVMALIFTVEWKKKRDKIKKKQWQIEVRIHIYAFTTNVKPCTLYNTHARTHRAGKQTIVRKARD